MSQEYASQDIMKDKLGYLTTDQIKSIYLQCKTPRDKMLIRLLWMSGRRISEILQLKVNDIDFERKLIVWNILKKKKPYRAQKTIDNTTLELLKWVIQEERLGYEHFIISKSWEKNKPISRQMAFKIVRKKGKQAGIIMVGNKMIHPHHFRHSRAVRLASQAKSPADIKLIQKVLEHSNIGMTEHYLGFTEEATRELISVE